jgi:hypothetical protein
MSGPGNGKGLVLAVPKDNMETNICECGEEFSLDCYGNARCEICDPPCPCCDDGGFGFDEDDEEVEVEDCNDYWDNF